MNSKLISFIKANIKVTLNVAMIILLTLAFCIIANVYKENKEINNKNNELNTIINTQEDTINQLSQSNTNLNSNVKQLKEINSKLQADNNLLEIRIQELLVDIEKFEKLIITPSYDDFKSYLPYDAITNQTSRQWQLQQQATTNGDGIRCIDGIPMVAVGTGWGLSVGDIALVTCDNGNSFKVIIGDIKADIHTDAVNKTTIVSGCRCEFIVELNKLDPQVKSMGNVAILVKYSGYVVNVEKIGTYN